jgi:hypothetical protein
MKDKKGTGTARMELRMATEFKFVFSLLVSEKAICWKYARYVVFYASPHQ